MCSSPPWFENKISVLRSHTQKTLCTISTAFDEAESRCTLKRFEITHAEAAWEASIKIFCISSPKSSFPERSHNLEILISAVFYAFSMNDEKLYAMLDIYTHNKHYNFKLTCLCFPAINLFTLNYRII